MKQRVLVIEDESAMCVALQDELEFEGYSVEMSQNGIEGLKRFDEDPPDLLVLDLMLPGLSGLDICRSVRRSGGQTPIIMLTARSEDVDKVRGLDQGADDYVTKPFNMAELMARIRALLRRTLPPEKGEASYIAVGELRVDRVRHEVFKRDRLLELTLKEYEILTLLMQRSGEVVSRDEFLNKVWGEEVFVTHRNIDSHIASLRKKVEDDPDRPRLILSVRGVGYKLHQNPTIC
jgi:DNA-binding response OmpR family regulator